MLVLWMRTNNVFFCGSFLGFRFKQGTVKCSMPMRVLIKIEGCVSVRERQGPDRNLSFSDVINHPFSPDFKCVGF